jgi:hypothetical protein
MTLSTLWASRTAAMEPASILDSHDGWRRPRRGRTLLYTALALVSVGGLASVPLACQSGGVGDPCTPEDEYDSTFAGFNVAQENIESRSFQCATRICLVNHFQGRVSCPQGQAPPKGCNPANHNMDCNTAQGEVCTASQVFAPTCTSCAANDPTCQAVPCPVGAGGTALSCDPNLQVCTCTTSDAGTIQGVNFVCERANSNDQNSPQVLRAYVCHKPNQCQTVADGTTTKNQINGVPKDCCIPGTDEPVAVSVCGQCDPKSKRNADQAVYCSCRCCAPCCDPSIKDEATADMQGCSLDASNCGSNCDPNFNYCSCPSGFTCTLIRKNVGLGDTELAGAYCIKQGSAYNTTSMGGDCGNVVGYAAGQNCFGMGTAASSPDAGM